MPLSIEGWVNTARMQRESDAYFISRFGEERFRVVLERRGVFAYGFVDDSQVWKVYQLVEDLGEEIIWSDDDALKKRYMLDEDYSWGRRFFHTETYDSKIISDLSKVLVIEKPFPNERFEDRLVEMAVRFRKVSVYDIGELSEEEIRIGHSSSGSFGGVWRYSQTFIDLDERLKVLRQQSVTEE